MSIAKGADLIDLLGKMVVQVDNHNVITAVNSVTSKVIGFSSKELIGQNWLDVFSIKDFDGDSISNVYENSSSFDGSTLTKEGLIRNIAWHKTNIYNEVDELTGSICLGEDVTKHENYLFTLHKIASLLLEGDDIVPYKKFVKLVGEAANADHTYIFINGKKEDGSIGATKVSEWGKHKYIDNSIELPGLKNLEVYEFAKKYTDTLKAGEAINLRVSSFPEWEQTFFKQFGICAILLIPIIIDQSFFGFVGFDNRVNDREWTNSELEFLKASVKNLEQRIIRSQALSLLKSSESRFRKLSALTIEGIIIHEKGIIREVNLASLKLVQYSYEEIIGCNIIDKLILPEFHEIVLENLKIRNPSPYEVLIRKKDGTIFPVEVEARSLEYEDDVLRVVAIRDITERRKTQEELVRQKNKAEESNRLKTQFLNNMSHEIRTPLNGIVGFSQFLNDPSVSVDQRKYFTNIIQSSSNQLVRVIDDIIEISKLETKQVKTNRDQVNLNSILLEIFSIFEFKAKEKNLSLYLKKSLLDDQSNIYTDRLKLQKVLNNLVENAIKFTHYGHVEVGYKIEKSLKVWVSDTGIGIPEKKQSIVFERFSQIENKDDNVYGGLGLGLSIAKENAQLIGGALYLESEEGKGSKFIIELPFSPLNKALVGLNINREGMTSYKVLVAEDEEVNYIFIEYLLQNMNEDIHITHVRNGKEVIEVFEENNEYDLVLMDLKMPIVNGIEATKAIKQIKPNVNVIAITAYTSAEDKAMAKEAGCIDFLTKPIQVNDFKKICARFLILK